VQAAKISFSFAGVVVSGQKLAVMAMARIVKLDNQLLHVHQTVASLQQTQKLNSFSLVKETEIVCGMISAWSTDILCLWKLFRALSKDRVSPPDAVCHSTLVHQTKTMSEICV
jgi:hypothetical protein